jgi:nicotinate-nucleotide adenylyltransferase
VQLVAALPSLAGRIHTIPGPGMDVSSSDIRARCARGASIAGLVHPAVAAYIATHQLYQATSNT